MLLFFPFIYIYNEFNFYKKEEDYRIIKCRDYNTWNSIERKKKIIKVYVFKKDIKEGRKILFIRNKDYVSIFYREGSEWIESEFGRNYSIYDLKNYYDAKLKKIIYRED